MLPPCLVPSHVAFYRPGRTRLAKGHAYGWYFSVVVPPFFASARAAQRGETSARRASGRADPGYEAVEAARIRGLQGIHHGEICRGGGSLDVGVAARSEGDPAGLIKTASTEIGRKDQGIAGSIQRSEKDILVTGISSL